MELRIFRRWKWELDCSPYDVRFGGKNPMKLVAYDELQYRGSGAHKDDWLPLPVVEDAKPEHPDAAKNREWEERAIKSIQKTFKNAKIVTLDELLAENEKSVMARIGRKR